MHRVTQNSVTEGEVLVISMPRKKFWNTILACVLLGKNFQNGILTCCHKNSPVQDAFSLMITAKHIQGNQKYFRD
jgi:hypothetical protein